MTVAFTFDTDKSTGFKDDFQGTILSSRWVTQEGYPDGDVLKWTVVDDEDGEEEDIIISPGSCWCSEDGGETVVWAPDNPKKKLPKGFHTSCIYGMILELCADPDNPNFLGKKVMTDIKKVYKNPNPAIAAIWNGLRFHFRREEVKFGEDADGNPIVSNPLLPVEYLGMEKKKKGKKNTKKAAKEEPKDDSPSLDKKTKKTLLKLALIADDSDDFVVEAMDLETGLSAEELAAFYEENAD